MQKPIVRVVILAALALTLVLGLSTAASASDWVDLPDTLTAEYGVTVAQVSKISQGFNGEWKPYRDITRAQFVKMAVMAFSTGQQDPDVATFTDVPKGSFYYKYIEGAKAAGLIAGATPTTFNPDEPITRQEAIAIIARRVALGQDLAARYTEGELESLLGNFADADDIAAALRPELAFAFESGIVKGSGGLAGPLANLWRIQAATLLIRSKAPTSGPPLGAGGDIAPMLFGVLTAALEIDSPTGALSWVLATIGLGLEPPDPTVQMLKDITAKLDALAAQVATLQNQVNNTSYNVLAASCGPVVSAIQTAQQLLTALAQSDAPSQSQINYIYNLIGNQIVPYKNQISNAMLGVGLADGLIKSWSRAVAGRHHFFGKADSEAQFVMYNYWMDIQAVQEQLILEYYHYQGFTKQTTYAEFDHYVMTTQDQRALYPRPFPYNASITNGVYVVEDGGKSFMLHAFVFGTRTKMRHDVAVQTIESINRGTIEAYAYNDWVMPQYNPIPGEVRSPDMPVIIKHPVPSNVVAWMVQEGWDPSRIPTDFVATGMNVFLSDVTMYNQPWWSPTLNPDTDYTSGNSFYGHVLPIRPLAPGEFYFYR